MPFHFDDAEYASRQARAVQAVNDAGLDALLMFAPESHYWICGYDTFGFAMFQSLVLTAKGDLHLITRMPDRIQAQRTSTLSDEQIHIWPQYEGSNPAEHLRNLLTDLGVANGRLGFESANFGLTDFNGQLLRAALPGLQDCSGLVADLRRVKSPAEIEMHRRAAALSDDALDAGLAATGPGAFEGDILAEMQGAVFRGGGDYAGNEFIIGSGPNALMCRYYSGRRRLDAQDQLTLEWAGAYARHHAAMMRTVVIGKPSDRQLRMHDACVQAIEACEAAIAPGKPMGDVFAAHAKALDACGFGESRLQACGYGMGAVYNPVWTEFPMFYENNPLIMQAGQVFFLHMILMDRDEGLAMCPGHSVLVTDSGIERLSRHPLELPVR